MNNDELIILDCTLRDGNYVVDFKFTEIDTSILTHQLTHLGFQWIELGHGLGLGAMEAGKGEMPSSDVELIQAARKICNNAKIGMFFIPGIGRLEHLDRARKAGLDFVRIGHNAPDVEKAYPYVTYARESGLIPCLNIMKSYGVTPQEFAIKAREAFDAGAEVVYCVDSAGGMFPDDVARYFDATREVTEGKLGFHGHNNLMLVISNCLTAYEHGARYLDTTLSGLGRSSGNAPTEILVAAFERLGISTGIDLFELMDTVEMYMWPLVAQRHPHDMMSVAAGYSQFHSSFLPKVAEVARKYNVEIRRLITKVAIHNPVTLEEDFLELAAEELANTSTSGFSEALLSFHAPGISRQRISNSIQSVQSLIEGMVASSAKRAGTRTVLHLVPSEEAMEGFLLPEFVLSDPQMIMGRVTFGSFDVLHQVIEIARPHIFMFLVNLDEGWTTEAPQIVTQVVDKKRVIPIRDKQIRKLFLLEALDRAAQCFGQDMLLVYSPNSLILEALETKMGFTTIFVFGSANKPESPENQIVMLHNLDDWRNLKLQFNVILCGANPTETDSYMLLQSLTPGGTIFSTMFFPDFTVIQSLGKYLVQLDLNLAYSGVVSRYLSMESIFPRTHLEKQE